jgi:hypothetical protein
MLGKRPRDESAQDDERQTEEKTKMKLNSKTFRYYGSPQPGHRQVDKHSYTPSYSQSPLTNVRELYHTRCSLLKSGDLLQMTDDASSTTSQLHIYSKFLENIDVDSPFSGRVHDSHAHKTHAPILLGSPVSISLDMNLRGLSCEWLRVDGSKHVVLFVTSDQPGYATVWSSFIYVLDHGRDGIDEVGMNSQRLHVKTFVHYVQLSQLNEQPTHITHGGISLSTYQFYIT